MSGDDDEILCDLAIRTRQLETHLLRSPEYLARAGCRLKCLAAILGLALLFLFLEGFFCLHETKPASEVVLGSIDITSIAVIASCVLIIRARRCLRHLNEGWLNAEARQALEALRREKAQLKSRASSPSKTR